MEVIGGESKRGYDFSGILDGFKNVKITPLFEDLDKLGSKKK